ncbi:MAG: flagellar filament capping protein FliD [Acidobacteriota bacterium]
MGSPITFSGFNNIDFNAVVNILIQAERQPITRLQSQKSAEQDRLTAFSSLSSTLSSVKSAFDSLESSALFSGLKANSSDTTVLTATATSAATRGTFTINVTSLARAQVTSSGAGQFSDVAASIIDGGSFSITQSGVTTNIDLTDVDSLTELRDAINSQQTGVRASIINDGHATSPFRLVLTSTTPGEAYAFTVNDQTTFGGSAPGSVLNLSTDPINGVATNTVFTYNGITINSSKTNISDAVPGLTLNLLKAGASTITVADDNSALKDKIKSAVNAFNSFNDFFKAQTKLAPSGSSRPPLATDPLLRSINRQLRSFVTTNHANSGSYKNLPELGITLSRDGKLQVDDAVLDKALAEKRSDVEAFFAGASGFATKFTDLIEGYTKSGGSLYQLTDRLQKTISSYDSRIADLESQLIIREKALRVQFTAADQAISQLNQQVNSLSSLSGQYRLF